MEVGRDSLTMAFGSTPNVAARLQNAAAADTVVISEYTRRLVAGQFVTEDLGERVLKGIDAPQLVHRVLRPSGVRSRLDISRKVTPMIGRDAELQLLLDRWAKAREARGQVVLISGDAGVGKSRLVMAMRERLATQAHTWLEAHCSPYTASSPFAAIADLVGQGIGLSDDDDDATKLRKLGERASRDGIASELTVSVFARLLGIDGGDAFDTTLSAQELRRHTITGLADWGLAMSEHQPVCMFVEDLHWCDPSSLEFLDLLVKQTPTARLCLVMTARPEFQVPWSTSSYFSPLAVGPLTDSQVLLALMAVRRNLATGGEVDVRPKHLFAEHAATS
jgi:hypothetical protein